MIKIFNLYSSLLIAIIIYLSNIIYIYAIDNPQNNINSTLVKNGKINSIVLDLPPWGTFDVMNISKYLLAGDWNISLSNERSINFMANFSMVSIKGENLHNHQFINFKTTNDTSKSDQLRLDRNVNVSGIMDITTNGDIKWNKIKTNISIYNDNTIIIDFDDKSPDQFIGQPVYGIVE
jgi:hypothetical protein